MEPTVEKFDVSALSATQLEKLLKEKQKQERDEKTAKKRDYETRRDILIAELSIDAEEFSRLMFDFKKKCLEKIIEFKSEAEAYGDIKKSSKGGFSLRSSDGILMVSYDRNTKPTYDERAAMAEALLKEFLEDKVKKKDIKDFRTIAALMERNKKGDFNPSSISALLKVKDNYDDERWVKAMELFEESFSIQEISYSVSFYKKNEQGKDELIPLNFTSI